MDIFADKYIRDSKTEKLYLDQEQHNACMQDIIDVFGQYEPELIENWLNTYFAGKSNDEIIQDLQETYENTFNLDEPGAFVDYIAEKLGEMNMLMYENTNHLMKKADYLDDLYEEVYEKEDLRNALRFNVEDHFVELGRQQQALCCMNYLTMITDIVPEMFDKEVAETVIENLYIDKEVFTEHSEEMER